METLQYREHKRFAIQGQIAAVRYMTGPKTTELQTREVIEMIGTHLFRSGHMQHWVPAGSSCASSRWRPTWSPLERWTDSKGQFNISISRKNLSQKKDSAEVSLGKGQIPWKSGDFSFKGHAKRVFQRGGAVCSASLLSSQTVEKGSPDGCSSAVLPGHSKLWSLLL